MPIKQSCPMHKKPYEVPDAGAGKKVRCPYCQTVYVAAAVVAHPMMFPIATFAPPLANAAETRPDVPLGRSPRRRWRVIVGAAAGVLVCAMGTLLLIAQGDGANPEPEDRVKPENEVAKKSVVEPAKDAPQKGKPDGNDAGRQKEDPVAPPVIAKDVVLASPPEDDATLLARFQVAPIDNLNRLMDSSKQSRKFEELFAGASASLPMKHGPDLDGTKPLGAYLQISPQSGAIRTVVLLPIRDRTRFLDAFGLPDTPHVDGNWLIPVEQLSQPVALRFAHQHAYLIFGGEPPRSDDALLKPTQVFAPPGTTLVSAVCRMDRLLPRFRAKYLADVKAMAGPVKTFFTAGKTKAQAAFAEKSFDALLGIQDDFFDGARDLSFTVEISPASGQMATQLQLDAVPGSNLAQTFRAIGAMRSVFGELLDTDAAMRFLCHVRMSNELQRFWVPVAHEITDMVLKDDSDPEALKEAKRVFRALQPAIDAAEIDLALMLASDGNSATVFGGVKALSSRQLEMVLQQKVSELPDADDRAVYHWNADRIDDVGVHRLDVAKLLGAKLSFAFKSNDFHLAFPQHAVLWAGGRGSLPLLAKGIRGRPETSPPLLLDLNVRKLVGVLPFADPAKETALASKFLTERNPGRVRLSLEGGASLRLRLSLDLSLVELAADLVSIQPVAGKKKP